MATTNGEGSESSVRRWVGLVGLNLAAAVVVGGIALGFRAAGVTSKDSAWWIAPLSMLFVGPISFAVQRLISRRHIRGDVVECAIRPVPSDPSRGRWRHGRLTMDDDQGLMFTSSGPAGMRFPRGEPASFPISSMSADEGRRPSRRQMWSINPGLHIVQVMSRDEGFELAALPSDLVRLRRIASAST